MTRGEKAKEYLSYRDELRNLDINVFLQDYKENSASMEELREIQRPKGFCQ